MVILLILFDFTKAFDSVCHTLLLHKLNNYSISVPILTWLESYLSKGGSH